MKPYLDIMSAADLGRVNGMAEWGKVLGLIGVISMCSVQDVSNEGRSNLSTSTLRVFCSNGTENVSDGTLCNQESRERSLSLKPETRFSQKKKYNNTLNF